jgi:hypothetical protein
LLRLRLFEISSRSTDDATRPITVNLQRSTETRDVYSRRLLK